MACTLYNNNYELMTFIKNKKIKNYELMTASILTVELSHQAFMKKDLSLSLKMQMRYKQ